MAKNVISRLLDWGVRSASTVAKGTGQKPVAPEHDISTRAASIRAQSIDEESASLTAVMATEGRVMVYDYATGRAIEEILLSSGAEFPEQVPLQDSHARYDVDDTLGSVRNIRQENGEIIGEPHFAADEKSQRTFQKYRDGHLTDFSIGYRFLEWRDIEPGKSMEIDGRNFEAGERTLRVVTRYAIKELSVVAIGADPAAKARQDESGIKTRKEIDMGFNEWLEKRGLKAENLDDAALDALRKVYDAEIAERKAAEEAGKRAEPKTEEGEKIDVRAAIAEGIAEGLRQQSEKDGERKAAIKKVCGDEFPELARKAIEEGWTADETKDKVIEEVRKGYDAGIGAPAIHVRSGEVGAKLLEDALVLRSGGEDILMAEQNGEERCDKADQLRGRRLSQIVEDSLRMDGINVPHDENSQLRAAFSSITLPNILGNVANKYMMKGYNSQTPTWRSWCTVGSVSDFKQVTKMRMTDAGDLVEVGNGGEVKHGDLHEEYEQGVCTTYAKQLTITRNNIVNDDLDAFTKVPQMLGVRANSRISKLVYTTLLANGNMADGTSIFDSTGHSNNQSGTSYKLSAGSAALRKALQLLMEQTDKDGEPIDIAPKTILCSPGDMEYARALLLPRDLAEGTTAGVAKANIWSSMGMQVAVESRLSNSAYTGYSTTAWYLMGDQNMVDTFEVLFLNGRQTPTLERFSQMDMGIDTLGIGFRVYIDAGVIPLDWRGMVKIDGA